MPQIIFLLKTITTNYALLHAAAAAAADNVYAFLRALTLRAV
jgi:hypothetical protein